MTKRIAIVNALIVSMTDSFQPKEGFVFIRDGDIDEVGAGAPSVTTDGIDIIDAAGAVLMPGLVNAHTHLYQVLLRAVWEDLELMPWLKRIYGCARVLTPEHFYAGSLLGCVESIRSGVTTVCEHNFLNPSAECASETIRAMQESGLRAVFARTIMDTGEIVPECTKEKPEQAFRLIEAILARHRSSQARNSTGITPEPKMARSKKIIRAAESPSPPVERDFSQGSK